MVRKIQDFEYSSCRSRVYHLPIPFTERRPRMPETDTKNDFEQIGLSGFFGCFLAPENSCSIRIPTGISGICSVVRAHCEALGE